MSGDTTRRPRIRAAGAWLTATALAAVAAPPAAAEQREALALTYPEGETISVKLAGTMRLPGASGEAKVERKKGSTEIEIELDEMKPAVRFGGDYATYVLWVASPEGHVDNTGEFILEGNRSKLDVSTPLETSPTSRSSNSPRSTARSAPTCRLRAAPWRSPSARPGPAPGGSA